MKAFRPRSTFMIVLSIVMLLLLGMAGHMIYLWSDRASLADHQQRKQFLDTAMSSVNAQFTAQVQEIVAAFRPISRVRNDDHFESELNDLYGQWQKATSNSQLLSNVSIGTVTGQNSFAFRSRNSNDNSFQTAHWPTSLEPYRELLAKYSQIKEATPLFPPTGISFAIDDGSPVIVFALMKVSLPRPKLPPGFFRPPPPRGIYPGPPPAGFQYPHPDPRFGPPPDGQVVPGRPGRPHHPSIPQPHIRTELAGLCFVRLNGDYIQKRLIPNLTTEVFGSTGLANFRLGLIN